MSEREPIRVVLADDHPLLNRGLSQCIASEEDMILVASAMDGVEALACIRKHEPDVIVLDIDMPRMNGLDVLATIQEEGLPTRAFMLTGSVQEDMMYSAITGGASGYLIKSADWPDIMQGIRDVAAGKTVVDTSMASTLAWMLQNRRAHADLELTRRERQVLALTAGEENLTAKQVGTRLGLSDRMIKKHLTHIYRKLGVTSKAEAVAEAHRRGLVE